MTNVYENGDLSDSTSRYLLIDYVAMFIPAATFRDRSIT